MGRKTSSYHQRQQRRSSGKPVSTSRAEKTERYPRASVALRLIALVYDLLLLIALTAVTNTVIIALFSPAGSTSSTDFTLLPEWVRYGLQLPATIAVIVGFYSYCWTRSGQTLGMQTWRLALVRLDGHLATWMDALRRCVAALVLPSLCGMAATIFQHDNHGAFAISVLAGFLLNYVWAWFPSRSGGGRCLHDFLSNTEVLRLPPQAKQEKKYRFLGLFGDK